MPVRGLIIEDDGLTGLQKIPTSGHLANCSTAQGNPTPGTYWHFSTFADPVLRDPTKLIGISICRECGQNRSDPL